MSLRPDLKTLAALALAALYPAFTPALASTDAPDAGWVDREQLAEGEILVRSSKDGPRVTVDVAALIDASAETIWNVITACEVAPEYVPNIESCESVEKLDGGRAELLVQTIKPIFFMPTFEQVLKLTYEPYERIDIERVSGPIEHMQGGFWFLPQANGEILLVHSLEVDPGFPVPRFLVRNQMKRDLAKIMEAVRDRSERRD